MSGSVETAARNLADKRIKEYQTQFPVEKIPDLIETYSPAAGWTTLRLTTDQSLLHVVYPTPFRGRAQASHLLLSISEPVDSVSFEVRNNGRRLGTSTIPFEGSKKLAKGGDDLVKVELPCAELLEDGGYSVVITAGSIKKEIFGFVNRDPEIENPLNVTVTAHQDKNGLVIEPTHAASITNIEVVSNDPNIPNRRCYRSSSKTPKWKVRHLDVTQTHIIEVTFKNGEKRQHIFNPEVMHEEAMVDMPSALIAVPHAVPTLFEGTAEDQVPAEPATSVVEQPPVIPETADTLNLEGVKLITYGPSVSYLTIKLPRELAEVVTGLEVEGSQRATDTLPIKVTRIGQLNDWAVRFIDVNEPVTIKVTTADKKGLLVLSPKVEA